MPWIALVCACVLGACSFEADYTQGPFFCRNSDACPADLECREGECRELRRDAAIDAPEDAMDAMDARIPGLTCNDPGFIPAAGDTVTGTTANKQNLMDPQCSTGVMNGFDAAYEIELAPGKQVTLAVSTTTSGYQVAAYLVAPCSASQCMSSTYATPGNPATITTTTTTPQFIVVDSIITNTGGDYTLTVTVD